MRNRRAAGETRAHILGVAQQLFYWKGIRSTGVDTVAAAADVAPTTLYRLFGSKDDLVAAYVAHNAEPYRAWVTEMTRPELGSPKTRILSLFDALQDQIQPERCRGCPFLMTLAEFPEPDHPARAVAIATKAWVRDRLRLLVAELSEQTPVADPAALADQLGLVMEGVYASVQALGADGPAIQARRAAETLMAGCIDAALRAGAGAE